MFASGRMLQQEHLLSELDLPLRLYVHTPYIFMYVSIVSFDPALRVSYSMCFCMVRSVRKKLALDFSNTVFTVSLNYLHALPSTNPFIKKICTHP